MTRRRRNIAPGLLTLWVVACSPQPRETTIAAAISLRDPLIALGEAFETRNPDLRVRFHFAASGVLVQQAAQGAPFDAMAFAGEEELDRLAASGRVAAGTRFTMASNRLVVVVPAGGTLPSRLEDLTRPGFERIALGNPLTVPAGRYARQALEGAGLWPALQPKLIYAEHAHQVIRYVAHGEVDAGIAYASDVIGVSGLQAALDVPPSLHDPIRYPAVILNDARNADGAARFLELLRGPLGDVVLRRHGFGPPG